MNTNRKKLGGNDRKGYVIGVVRTLKELIFFYCFQDPITQYCMFTFDIFFKFCGYLIVIYLFIALTRTLQSALHQSCYVNFEFPIYYLYQT